VAVSSVKLIVDAAGAVNPLKRVTKETEKLEGAVRDVNGRLGDAKGRFVGAGKGAQSFTKSLGGLKGAILGLGLAALTKKMVGQAASFAETKVRLKALSAEYGEYGRIQQLVKQNAETFNQSQAESASNFADVFARLRPLGTSLEDIQTVYKGFNATALASGTSAAAASGAFLQLSQALGSGRLQGDEFRSIAEQVPGILRLVSAEMNVTVGELKKLGSDGKITSDILINSLAKGFEENKDKIQQLLDESPAQKFKAFGNAVSELSNAVGTELLPVVTPAVEELTKLLKVVGQLPKPVREVGAAILLLTTAAVALAPAIKGIGAALAGITGAGLLAAGPWIALAAGITATVVALNRYNAAKQPNVQNLKRVGVELNKADKVIEGVKAKLAQTTDERARAALKSDLESLRNQRQRIVKEFNRLNAGIPLNAPIQMEDKERPKTVVDIGAGTGASLSKDPQDISAEMEALLLKQQKLRFSNDKLAQSTLQYEIDIQRIIESQSQPRQQNLALVTAENDELFRKREILKKIFKEPAAIDKKIKDANVAGVRAGFAAGKETDDKLQEQAKKLDSLYKGIGNTIQTGIVDAIDTGIEGLINGTKDLGESLQEIASGVLRDIGKQLLSFGVKLGLQSLGASFFAEGGYVTGPTNAVIGEGGEPEYVIPESKMNTAMSRYSQGGRGSSVLAAGGSSPSGRGGGGAGGTVVNYNGPTLKFNSEEFVPVSAVSGIINEAAKKGAKAGEQRTFATLKNSRSQRSRLGL
tara:strand:- start:9642 stop:11915 length:2274 start_codon:yes stop_codon:yes gene_type:complete